MTQENDEIVMEDTAECWINTNAITRGTRTEKMHRIRWTIENVSRLPLDTKVIGPDFYLAKTCLCNISFKKAVSQLYVYLNNKKEKNVKIERRLVLFDCEGKALHHDKMGDVFTLETNKDCDIIASVENVQRFNSLKDDILIIDCHLKVEGYLTAELCFSKYEGESREHLINDLKSMFNNPVDSDFSLQIGSEVIYAHKNILRARSTYFKRMLETEMKESIHNSVSITDVSHPTMLKLVEFLYTGTLENNVQNVSDLYIAADKYEVVDLKVLCVNKLKSTATVDSIAQILQLSQRHNDDDLKSWAMNFVALNFDEVKKTDSWKTMLSTELSLASEVLSFCFKRFKFVV